MLAQLPLAAIEDWLKFVIPLVFFVIYAINQLIAAAKANTTQTRNAPQRRKLEGGERPPRPPQQAPQTSSGPSPGAPAPSGQAQLNAEIEQFLKRANERRGERPRRGAPVTPRPKAPPKPPVERALDVQPLPRGDFGGVASSVEKHLGDRGFRQRAEHLADDIVRADQQMEEHLQKSFGHKVGTLGGAPAQAITPVTDAAPKSDAEKSSTAITLAALLSNPQNLKQMIVLKEILERPEHRW